jgi:hypothetical protein
MYAQMQQMSLLLDLEARQENLLLQLDELDKRVEKVLAECQTYRINPFPTDQVVQAE